MEPRLRIGELARRTHVSPDVLRAWERRYGLLDPQRSDGGYRLYSGADEERVQAMVAEVRSAQGRPFEDAQQEVRPSAANLVLDGEDLLLQKRTAVRADLADGYAEAGKLVEGLWQ